MEERLTGTWNPLKQLHILHGPGDWTSWKRDLNIALISEGLEEFLTDDHAFVAAHVPKLRDAKLSVGESVTDAEIAVARIEADNLKNEREFKKREATAKKYLMYTIKEQFRECLDETKTVKEMYDRIEELVGLYADNEARCMEQKIRDLTLKSDENILDYLNRCTALWNKYKQITTTEKMGESHGARFMLEGIPNRVPYSEEKALIRYVAETTKMSLIVELVDTRFRKRATDIILIENQRAQRHTQRRPSSGNFSKYSHRRTNYGESRNSDPRSERAKTTYKKVMGKTAPDYWKTLKCCACNQKGHLRRHCPTRQCYWCQEMGHVAINCP